MSRDDSLETLKKKLYDKNWEPSFGKRDALQRTPTETRSEWDPHPEDAPNQEPIMGRQNKPMSLISKLLLGSLLFFSLSVAIAGAVLYFKLGNTEPNVELVLNGPRSISGGEVATVQVTITNKDENPLLNSVLVIEYPSGTRDPLDPTKELTRERIPLGEIKATEVLNRTVKAIFFGAADTRPELTAQLEYTVPESVSLYVRSATYTVTLAAAPVDVFVELPKEINPDQEITATIRVISNAKTTLKNVALQVGLPYGFATRVLEPEPSQGTSFWRFGDLAPGAERTVSITGIPRGGEEEVKGISASVGTEDTHEAGILAIIYNTAFESVALARPYIALGVTLLGDTKKEIAAPLGEPINGAISWQNTTNTPVSGGTITLSMSGPVDEESVTASEGGFYNSLNNTIIWDGREMKELQSIAPGARENVQFSFKAKTPSRTLTLENPSITISILFTGTRVAEGFTEQKVESLTSRTVKFGTQVAFSADGYYSVGPIRNTGPIPPKVGAETTYTIIWTLANPSNDVETATVEAVLPVYIQWKGATSPVNESVLYNPNTHTVSWDVQHLKRGTGVGGAAPRSVSFQVGITPSISQVGEAPTLVLESLFKGTDTFTKTLAKVARPAINTRIVKDPAFRSGTDEITQ